MSISPVICCLFCQVTLAKNSEYLISKQSAVSD